MTDAGTHITGCIAGGVCGCGVDAPLDENAGPPFAAVRGPVFCDML